MTAGSAGFAGFAEIRDELRAVARDLLGKVGPQAGIDWRLPAGAGWLGLEVPAALGGADATFAEVAVIVQEMGRAAARCPYLGGIVLGVGTLILLEPGPGRDRLLRQAAAGNAVPAAALTDGEQDVLSAGGIPFRLERSAGGPRLHGRAAFTPDAADASRLLLLAAGPDGTPVIADLDPQAPTADNSPHDTADRAFRSPRPWATSITVAGDSRGAWGSPPIVGGCHGQQFRPGRMR